MRSFFPTAQSSVFKRVDAISHFQITCSDIRERFQLLLVLAIISVRGERWNWFAPKDPPSPIFGCPQLRSLAEMKWDQEAFAAVQWKIAAVYISEVFLDTLKHSFIIR